MMLFSNTVRVDIYADLELYEPIKELKELDEYVNDKSFIRIGEDNKHLYFKITDFIEFENLMDFITNLNKRVIESLNRYLIDINKWAISYSVKQIEGHSD